MSDSTTLVIFGASGDLVRRKLVPALFSLHRKRRLPEGFRLLGFSRTPKSDDMFRSELEEALGAAGAEREAWPEFAAGIGYQPGDPGNPRDLAALDGRLRAVEEKAGGRANRLYYLATPPQVYLDAIRGLGLAGMVGQSQGWRRVVIEKPFGSNLATARALNDAVHRTLAEEQVYRIDHYLGKETVQNVLVFRFANSIFEPIWNRNYIDHVQITVAETDGVEHRGQFYDSVGVLRDMFQNHFMQLISLMAMEPPASFVAEALRNERVKVLAAIRPVSAHSVASNSVRGQYRGYRTEPGVSADSATATYAAVRFHIDNWRWQDVPFYLRSGKRLAAKTTEVFIQFKSVPHSMFTLPEGTQIPPNALAICLQPDEGMHLRFEVKVPDTTAGMRTVDMDFHYDDHFPPGAIPEAYERLLLDALNGDASLFTRADSIELAWALIDPIVDGWQGPAAPPLEEYEAGCWGPPSAATFIRRDGREWALGCGRHAL
ncbi:MAG: glucose-6-phosphate dehydrogenase [Chloroflexi bacterium RBG_13_66_10]|nr:MAG: glucose-6-phosphate dehydrogenase [Chloroflexi bacterium RBG_13_66_10]